MAPMPGQTRLPPAAAFAAALLAASLCTVMAVRPARAGEAEAKEVARSANCPPGKVEVLRRMPGTEAEAIYKIACTGQKDVFVTVRCAGRLCILLRALQGPEEKPTAGG